MTSLYHLVSAADWPTDPESYHPASLDSEGFIHLSDAGQVPGTSLRYYTAVTDLMVIRLDSEKLTAELIWEDTSGNGEFPHLYGHLNGEAVVSVRPYTAGTEVEG